MKNIKVSFHHTYHIYKFKLDLHVYENSNMLNIDARKTTATFQSIVNTLILTIEEKIIFQTLSLAFKAQFLKKYEQALKERKGIDYLGSTIQEQLEYFQNCLQVKQGFVSKCKQMYIFLTRTGEQTHKFKQHANKPRMYKLIYKFASGYQNSGEQSKINSYIFYYCLLSNIIGLLMSHSASENDKLQIIQIANKCALLALDKILNHYEYTYLNAIFDLAMQIWRQCLHIEKNNAWLYKKHEDEMTNTSTLRFLTQCIKIENKNFNIQADIVRFLLQTLEKCDGVNELLLFVTQCINLRITTRLDLLNQSVSMLKFNRQNSIYLNLPKDLTQDLGKKVIRMKQKTINQQTWNSEINICKLKLKQLIERFVRFKHGKIQAKKPKQVPYKSQRERIRKESFIMTNFQEIKHKYEEALLHQDHNSQNYKLLNENKELLQMNKNYQEKIKEKQALIAQLELAVAQFVDVRQKYVRQNILKIYSKVSECKIQQNFGQSKVQQHASHIDSLRKSVDKYKQIFHTKTEISSSLILPPPPPPPPFQKPSGLRGSRKSNEIHILPPPPPPPSLNLGLPQLLLPPPPPLSLPLLHPPPPLLQLPSLSSLIPPTSTKTINRQKKDVKMINWTTVEISKVKDSFWENVKQVQVNEKQLISFFAKKQDITAKAPKIIIAPQRQKKSLLRPQRAKNIQIILKKTRIAIPQIPQAIQQLDQEVLTPTNADNLLNALPTSEQTEMYIQLLINDPEEWSNADLYFCLITKIHGYSQILQAIKFKSQFEFIAEKYNEKLNEFQQFFVELEKDAFFQTFLSYLLSVGNFMNNDTSKGNAYGFKLESIEKSYSLMGEDKKTSLFEYIMEMMVKKDVKFPEISYYKNKRITPIQVLKDDLKQLTKECRNVQQCLLMSGEDDLRTPQVFLSFYIESRQKISLMDAKYNDCVRIFNKVCDFYCEKMQSQKIARIVSQLKERVYKYLQRNKIEIKK